VALGLHGATFQSFCCEKGDFLFISDLLHTERVDSLIISDFPAIFSDFRGGGGGSGLFLKQKNFSADVTVTQTTVTVLFLTRTGNFFGGFTPLGVGIGGVWSGNWSAEDSQEKNFPVEEIFAVKPEKKKHCAFQISMNIGVSDNYNAKTDLAQSAIRFRFELR
jgi:hypothetical protein